MFETIDDVYWRATVGDIIAAHSDPQHPLRALDPQRFTTVHRQVTALLTRAAATVGWFRLRDQVSVRPPGRQVAVSVTAPDTSVLDLVGQLRADIRNLRIQHDRSEMSRLMSQHSATIDVLARTIRAADHPILCGRGPCAGAQGKRNPQAPSPAAGAGSSADHPILCGSQPYPRDRGGSDVAVVAGWSPFGIIANA